MPYTPPSLCLKAIACKNLVGIVSATVTIEFVLDNGCQHAGPTAPAKCRWVVDLFLPLALSDARELVARTTRGRQGGATCQRFQSAIRGDFFVEGRLRRPSFVRTGLFVNRLRVAQFDASHRSCQDQTSTGPMQYDPTETVEGRRVGANHMSEDLDFVFVELSVPRSVFRGSRQHSSGTELRVALLTHRVCRFRPATDEYPVNRREDHARSL